VRARRQRHVNPIVDENARRRAFDDAERAFNQVHGGQRVEPGLSNLDQMRAGVRGRGNPPKQIFFSR
jgi:hypothetical protein